MESRKSYPVSPVTQNSPLLQRERTYRFLIYFMAALLLALGSLLLADMWLYRGNLQDQAFSLRNYFSHYRLSSFLAAAIPLGLVLAGLAFIAAKARTLVIHGRRQIAESESKLRMVLDNTLALAWLKDRDGRYLFINRPLAELLEIQPEEAIGQRDVDLLPFEDYSPQEHDQQVINSGDPLYSEDRVSSRGVLRIYHTVRFPLKDTGGGIYGVCGISTDMTDLMQAREQMNQAMTVFNHTKEGILITDENGIITTVNPAYQAISGYSPEELIGQDIRSQSLSLQDEELFQALMTDLEQTGAWQGELQNRRKNGDLYPAWETVTTVRQDHRAGQFIFLVSDISTIRATEQRLQYLVHYDSLTGLANRFLFHERLQQALAEAERQGCKLGVLFINIDQFKLINDSLGHSVGDEVLYELARRLKQPLRSDDMVARLSGDEFAIILSQLERIEDIDSVVQKIVQSTSAPMKLSSTTLSIGVSIGISVYPNDSTDVDGLLAAADIAVYRAKKKGRRTYAYYTKELARLFYRRHKAEQDLRRALDDNQLRLYYQPQVSLESGQPVGVEALLRWQHPTQGIVSPTTMIQVAEDSGLIHELGEWIFKEAYRQALLWRKQNFPLKYIAVNVSGHQVMHGQLVELISRHLLNDDSTTQHDEDLALEIEITESVLQHPKESTHVIEQIRHLGFNVVIDDFGTGYSSLSQLQELAIDKLKIAGTFMEQIPEQKSACAIASAIVSLGHSLGLPVVAEGVENEKQLNFLKSIQCDIIQGYYYAKPLPAEELERLPLFADQLAHG